VLHTHYHSSGASPLRTAARKTYDPSVGRFLVSTASGIIANSESELLDCCRRFASARTKPSFVIYNGVDTRAIKAAPPYEFDGKLVLWVSRLERYKNAHLLIEAMKYLPKEYRAVIIGTGPEERRLVKLIERKELASRVQMLSSVPDGELYRWYRTAHVFVHLSMFESFGMTCIEALAAGCPSVVNDDGAGLTETARMFPSDVRLVDVRRHGPQRVAAAIAELANRKAEADVSAFDWDVIAQRLEVVYHYFLGGV